MSLMNRTVQLRAKTSVKSEAGNGCVLLVERESICLDSDMCNSPGLATYILRKTIEGYGFCFDFIAKGIIFFYPNN